MPKLFTKPLEALDKGDVEGLLGWPESLTVEFKVALPTKDGRPDAWLTGGKVGDFAREKLLKEVVALANTSGGHVVLGIEDDKGAPPAAVAIQPVPRCIELAQRLSQMAQHVDPPIPLLLVHGIVTDGEAGIVLFRVPSSRSAPHRAPDRECYVRRGTESVPVSMREIQNMSISTSRRGEWTEKRQGQARELFHDWMAKPLERFSDAVGIRVTAVPLGGPLTLDRLFVETREFAPVSSFTVDFGRGQVSAGMIRTPENTRAILRGIRQVWADYDNPAFIELYTDGCVSACMQVGIEQNPEVYLRWIIPWLLNALRGVQFLRDKAESPELEYAVDLEVDSRPRGTVTVSQWGRGFDDKAGTIITPLSIPALSFGPLTDAHLLLGLILTDLRDAAGGHYPKPLTFSPIPGL